MYYGTLMFVSGGNSINMLPDWYIDGLTRVVGTDAHGNPYMVDMQMLGLALGFPLLGRTSVGRQLRALGGNPEAAKRVGFSALRLTMVACGTMGVTAGLASLVQARVAGSVVPNALVGREPDVLAAVVLGGASLTGGVGKVAGLVIALVILQLISTASDLLGFSQFLTLAIWGGILIAGAAAARLREFLAL